MPVSVYCWSDWPLSCVRVTLSSPVSYFVSFSDSFLDPPGKPAQKFGKYFVKNWDTDDNILFFQALWLGCNISPPPPIFAFPHKHNLHSQQNKVNLGRVDHPEPRLPGPKLHPEDFESDAAGLSDCCSVNARNFPSVAAWQPPRWEGRNSANVLLDLGQKEIFASYGP